MPLRMMYPQLRPFEGVDMVCAPFYYGNLRSEDASIPRTALVMAPAV